MKHNWEREIKQNLREIPRRNRVLPSCPLARLGGVIDTQVARITIITIIIFILNAFTPWGISIVWVYVCVDVNECVMYSCNQEPECLSTSSEAH